MWAEGPTSRITKTVPACEFWHRNYSRTLGRTEFCGRREVCARGDEFVSENVDGVEVEGAGRTVVS